MADLLDLGTRRRLHALVQAYPGLHLREAARQLGTSIALVEYHAAILRENGLLRQERDERYVRLFAVDPGGGGPTEAERRALAALRERLPLRITLHLLDQDAPQQHKDVARALGLGKSKLSFHLRKLEAAGIVEKDADGRYAVRGRARLLALLLSYQPTPDLREAFADVWLSLYGDKA
ncbi:MAG TPA: winged helix-turn-helix transcriptional regulator [Candidatus Thermoplasmatota archaeon]|nr:winged helix-turn-helix transcriptional regulator [Candidatus Thermoplasmatota archaeon]